jgi:ArsR family transcriptional regulator
MRLCPTMTELNKLAETLDALGHPLRLKILAQLTDGELYLNEIANKIGISRALAKVHLKKLERAGLVKSRVVVIEGEAKALRYYKLLDFEIHVTPQTLKEEVKK